MVTMIKGYHGWCMCLIPSPNEQSECNECCYPVPRGIPLQPLEARKAGIDANILKLTNNDQGRRQDQREYYAKVAAWCFILIVVLGLLLIVTPSGGG